MKIKEILYLKYFFAKNYQRFIDLTDETDIEES